MKRLLVLVFLYLALATCGGCANKSTLKLTSGDWQYNTAGYGSEYKVYSFDELEGVEVHTFGDENCSTYLLVEADDGDGQGTSYGSFTLYDVDYSFVAVSSGGFLLSNGEEDVFISTEDMHSLRNFGGVKIHKEIPEEEWFYPSSSVEYSR